MCCLIPAVICTCCGYTFLSHALPRRRRRIKDLSEAMFYQNDFYPTPSRSSRSMWGLVLSSVFDGRGAHILCRARRYFFDWAADLVVTSITPAAPCTP